MKKILTAIAAFVAFSSAVSAQTDAQRAAAAAAAAIADAPKTEAAAPKPKYWTSSLMTNINFIQSSYTNWSKGGYNNYTMSAYVDAKADYKKNDFIWNNRLQLDYGLLYSEDKPVVQKNKDRILLESTAGQKINKSLSYTAKFTFLNQFANGYNYPVPASGKDAVRQEWKDARVLKSAFCSPAIATLGLGIDWNPKPWLKVNFAPLTGGFTIVQTESLRNVYGMGFKDGYTKDDLLPADPKARVGGLVDNGDIMKGTRFEFGTQLTLDAKVQVNENFQANTQLILFSNYLHNPQNVRVNWDNRFMWKVAKYFSVNLTTSLVYDDTVLIVNDSHPLGWRHAQFYEALQFGFTYTFATKK